jgi:hypothetical protein
VPAASFYRPSSGETANAIDPLFVFVARAEARAILLFAAGKFDLHAVVDPLQLYAVESGLIERIGQGAVQQILSHAFERAA